MARRSNKSRRERDHSLSPLRSLDDSLLGPRLEPTRVTDFYRPGPVVDPLTTFEDRRSFWPEPARLRPAATVRGTGARLVLSGAPAKNIAARRSKFVAPLQTKSRLVFDAPDGVLVCVRRQRRKEVLHAKRKAGRGGGQRKRRRNEWSDVSCR